VSAEQLLLGGEPRYTRSEAARAAGIELERASRLWRSLGYATPGDDERVFTDADVEALRTVTALHDVLGADAEAEFALARTLGQAMARLSEWQVGLFGELVGGDVDDLTEHSELASTFVEQVERLQQYVWRRHLLAASQRLGDAPPPSGGGAPLGVGFVDIAGFTSLSRGLTEADLSAFLESFESDASAIVAEHGGRVIKTVGDELMFVADAPAAVARIGLDLADRLSTLDDRPDLHIGLAYGPVLHRLGDVYGTVVNLAARLAGLARPGSVLIDRELAGEIGEDPEFRVRRLRRVAVRGFAHLQPWLLRRA
jgi:adenylate cyclase